MHHLTPSLRLFLLFLPSLFLFEACQQPANLSDPDRPESFTQDSLRAIQLNNKAELFGYQFQPDSGIYYFEKLGETIEPLLPHTNDSLLWALYIDSYFNRGFLSGIQRKPESFQLLDTALQMTLKHFGEEHLITTKCYNKLGWYHVGRGELSRGHELLHRSLKIRQKILRENDLFLSHGYNNVASYYYGIGDWENALAYGLKALSVRRRIYENADHTLRTLSEVEEVNIDNRSVPVLKDLFLTNGISSTCHSYLFVGEIYHQLGNQREADWHLKQGIKILKENPDIDNPVFLHAFLEFGVLTAKMGNLDKGKKVIQDAFAHYADSYPSKSELRILKNLTFATIHFLEGRYQEAIQKYLILEKENILDSYFAQKDHFQPLAFLFTKLLRYEKALQYIQAGLKAMIPSLPEDPFVNPSISDIPYSNFEILKYLSLKGHIFRKMYRNTGNKKLLLHAMECLQLAMDYLAHLEQLYFSDASKLGVIQKNYQLSELAINTALDLYDLEKTDRYLHQAFELAEQNKAATLRNALQRPEALKTADVSSKLAEEYAKSKLIVHRCRQAIYEEKNKGTGLNTAKMRQLENQLLIAYQQRDSLEKIFIEKHPEYLQLLYTNRKVKIAATQQALSLQKSSTTLLEYFLGDTTLVIYYIRPDTFSVLRRRVGPAFFGDLRRLRNSMTEPPNETGYPGSLHALSEAAHRLYRQLIPDGLEIPEGEKLLIIPDGRLNGLPFEILLEDPVADQPLPQWPFLLRRYPLRYEYSAAFLRAVPSIKPAADPYVGFAPAYAYADIDQRIERDTHLRRRRFSEVVRNGLSPLRHNEPEVKTTAGRFNGAAMTGPLATEKAFKEQAAQYRILHLAMHALINDTDPQYSQLLFSEGGAPDEDGRLHVYELYNMKLNAEMVVLSACNTGAGRLQRGEGTMSLARAFKYAGCPNIVMSLWPANDATTKDIMIDFFDHLKEGLPKDEALRQAKLDFLANPKHLEQQHPFFWAAFVLIGDGEPMEFGQDWKWWVLASTGLLLVSGWVFLYYRRRK